MKYPGFIAWLAKQASIGPAYEKPRPAETPSQARKAVPQRTNFGTGVLQNTVRPQQRIETVQAPQLPQQPQQLPSQIGMQ